MEQNHSPGHHLLRTCHRMRSCMSFRGEVGAGIIFIALGYNLGGPALVISVLTLVLNLILTGIFVLWVKNLALRSYND